MVWAAGLVRLPQFSLSGMIIYILYPQFHGIQWHNSTCFNQFYFFYCNFLCHTLWWRCNLNSPQEDLRARVPILGIPSSSTDCGRARAAAPFNQSHSSAPVLLITRRRTRQAGSRGGQYEEEIPKFLRLQISPKADRLPDIFCC